MVRATVDSVGVQDATAECHGAEHRTCSNGSTLSHFQILMNSAAVTLLCHGAGAAGAVCRCRVPRYRVPLQSAEVQGALYATMDPTEGAGCLC